MEFPEASELECLVANNSINVVDIKAVWGNGDNKWDRVIPAYKL